MKKIILGLSLFIFLAFSFVGTSVLAADSVPDGCNITNTNRLPASLGCSNPCSYSVTNCGMCCLLNSIYTVTDWIFIILIAVSSLMIIAGAILFTTSAGDPTKTEKARQLIIFAAVGIAVSLFSRAIPPIIKFIMGVN